MLNCRIRGFDWDNLGFIGASPSVQIAGNNGTVSVFNSVWFNTPNTVYL
ncbi:hypothetical protein EYZ11_010935 [Aspergillus tanneri]|uniref:Uncharacterized protein n=1 Tax=Aspergillus tanneri TaxID=1220188 RepID=A0A4V3UN32_9EURO|nr:hypothetical protein EYZ11_010935 [Aspergillus tanneri]